MEPYNTNDNVMRDNIKKITYKNIYTLGRHRDTPIVTNLLHYVIHIPPEHRISPTYIYFDK